MAAPRGPPTIAAMPPAEFGALLRQWRNRQKLSQLELALRADVSARHLSFVETGRAQPSREMVLLLAEVLDVPLRERNRLLRAAGFADQYRETALDDPELAAARRALEFVLERHEPFPAAVVGPSWEVRMANRAALRLIAHFAPEATPRPNLMRLLFDPRGTRPFVVNWEEVASGMIQRVHREALAGGPGCPSEGLLRELLDQPEVPADWRRPDLLRANAPFFQLVLERDGLRLSLFTTIATFGTPHDVTLQELRLETFFAADEATDQALRRLAG
jgi:transcriptional regulator with XRE-family HTH domain